MEGGRVRRAIERQCEWDDNANKTIIIKLCKNFMLTINSLCKLAVSSLHEYANIFFEKKIDIKTN